MRLKQSLKNTVKTPLQFFASHLGKHRRAGNSQLWTLMYHRVLPESDPRYLNEEPGMLVEPQTFREHIQQLKQFFTIVPLSEWIDRYRQGKPLPPKACAITFDDGWLDNYEYAFPILQEEQVPATLFAVSNMIGTSQVFWPNRVAHLLEQLSREDQHALDWLEVLRAANPEQSSDGEALSRLVSDLKQYPDKQIIEWLNDAESEHNIKPASEPALMSWAQLHEMKNSGLVEVGSHTQHHFRLNEGADNDTLKKEIIDSKTRLQEELESPVNLFCYPNGDLCKRATELVADHYVAAVTTDRGINSAGNLNLHSLRRIAVHQDGCSTPTKFQSRLSGWM